MQVHARETQLERQQIKHVRLKTDCKHHITKATVVALQVFSPFAHFLPNFCEEGTQSELVFKK